MGRANRIQFPGACYFITLKGNNRQDIFLSNQDRRFFLGLLKTYKERSRLKIFAFCLMGNFVQLVIETEEANLSETMQGFNTTYTKYFNKNHNTTGHLFQGRYEAVLIDPKTSLADATCYVHLTPVREGLKFKPWRYPWSSCAAYVESLEGEELVDSEAVLRQFAKNRLKQSVKYLHYLKEAMKAPAKAPPAPQSSTPPAAAAQKPPASQDRARQILEEVLSQGVEEKQLFGPSRWREIGSIRKKAIYRLWKEAHFGVTELGRMFHRTPSAISQMIHSIEFPGPKA